MPLSRRTWLTLLVVDVVIWVIAEVQNSTGWRGTLFDVVWVASLLGFVLLLVVGVILLIMSRRSQAA